MATMMHKIIQKMSTDLAQLNVFLEKWDSQHSGEDLATRAALKTSVMVVPTENHGYFELDGRDIIDALRRRRDCYERELKQYDATGNKLPDPIPED